MPSVRRTLLRPAVLASVLAHGGLVAAGWWGASAATPSRPATITGFVSEAWSGTVDADATPPPPDLPRETPVVEAEPRPLDAALEADPPPDLEALPAAPDAAAGPGAGRVPVGLRTARPEPAPVPAATPVAGFVAPAEVAQRAGGGPTRDAVPAGNRKPPYPSEALRQGWEGVARLVVEVRADGTVGDVRLSSSSGHAVLDEAALAAARAWRYEPRLVDGVPAPDLLEVPVVFRLR